YDSVESVLWTGLDDVAAVVAIGRPESSPGSDLVVVTSTDGGQTFDQAKILSIPTPQGDSGGEILPGSVHASLGYARTRADASAGTKSVPIHVIWKNASVEGIGWWMTQLIVGPDGSPAQTMYPVKVDVIPSGSAGHASILGYEDPGGDVVEVLWSERTDD